MDAKKDELARLISAIEAAEMDIRALYAPDQATVLSAAQVEEMGTASALVAKSRALLDTLKQRSDVILAEARKEGYQKGLADAERSLSLARQEYDALMQRAEPDMVSLALELARRVLGHKLSVDPTAMNTLLQNTLELARGRRLIELRVHPEDYEAVARAKDKLQNQSGAEVLRIIADDRIPRHGCRVETETGVIETDVETQIKILSESLGVATWDRRGHRRGDGS